VPSLQCFTATPGCKIGNIQMLEVFFSRTTQKNYSFRLKISALLVFSGETNVSEKLHIYPYEDVIIARREERK
jgi:hypothetical protein